MNLVQSHTPAGLPDNLMGYFYTIRLFLQRSHDEQHNFFKLPQVDSFHKTLNPFLLNKYATNVKSLISTELEGFVSPAEALLSENGMGLYEDARDGLACPGTRVYIFRCLRFCWPL